MQREEHLEDYIVDELLKRGWRFVTADSLERTDLREPLLSSVLAGKILQINKNKGIAKDEVQKALNDTKLTLTGIEGSKRLLRYFKYGIPRKFEGEGTVNYVMLFDYDNPKNNDFVISRQVFFTGVETIKVDIILYVNGIPVVNIECKDPTNPAESWENAYKQIKDYEQKVPELYKYVQLGVAIESTARYFPIVPWQQETATYEWRSDGKDSIDATTEMLLPENFLDLLRHYFYIREEHAKVTKVLARYMQHRAATKIYNRIIDCLEGRDVKNKGLVWHWQGSGKTLTMIFAAHKLHLEPLLANPTIFFIVDRDELQQQLEREYAALDLPGAETIGTIKRLKDVLTADSFRGERGLFIVLVHKFRPEELQEVQKFIEENKGQDLVSSRKNVVAFIDEGHRSEYGVLASQMKNILKSAFFFAFTGTPIAKRGKDTYVEFSYPPQEMYLDKYFINTSISDEYTKAIAYEPRLDKLHVHKDHLQAFLKSPIEELGEERGKKIEAAVRQKLDAISVFLENPTRIKDIVDDISTHFKEEVEGRFKAMIVTGSRKACVRYKDAIDKFLPARTTEVIISDAPGKDPEVDQYLEGLQKRNQNKPLDDIRKDIIDRFKEEDFPQILIVTDMLITGFDAPVLQTMYLDKLLKEHRLLQAIARTNRPYKEKEVGLVIDYAGITDQLHKAFEIYDESELSSVLINMEKLKKDFADLLSRLLAILGGIEHSFNHNVLVKAVETITASKKTEQLFVQGYRQLRKYYELLGADESKVAIAKDYAWLTAVYTFYNKLVYKQDEDADLIQRYYKRTLSLIYNDTQVDAIQHLPTRIVINEDFVRDLNAADKTRETRAANIAFALNKLVLVDRHQNPIYESLIERVERLMKLWQNRQHELVFKEGSKIVGEVLALQKQQQELGLTDAEMGLWLSIKDVLEVQEDAKLIDAIKQLFRDLGASMIPSWASNVELRKKVEARLREFIFKNIKTQYGLSLDQVNQIHKKVSDNIASYESHS